MDEPQLTPRDMSLVADVVERRPQLKNYQNFYDGNTKVSFIGEEVDSAVGKKLRHQSVNRIQPIIDLTLDKLNLEGWGDGDETSEDDQLADELWHELELDVLQHRVHADALVKGAGYLLVWTDANDNLIVGVQEPEQIALSWDPEDPDRIDTAIKVWRTATGNWRLNRYTDKNLEKYITKSPSLEPPTVGGAWERYQDEEDLHWPLQHSFGIVPIFHFKVTNRAASYGTSDIQPLLSLQDKLNSSLAYESVAMEKNSWPDRWLTGFSVMKDEEGNVISPFSSDADSIWAIASKEARFGQFDGTDLTKFEDVIEGDEARIARTARIPIHYLLQNGSAPSGEALKTSEAMWVSKIVARQRMFGLVWTKIIKLAMHLKHGNDLNQRFYPMWTSAETRDETNTIQRKTLLQNLINQGKYAAQVLKELGYTQDQIDYFEELRIERLDEQAQRVLEGF